MRNSIMIIGNMTHSISTLCIMAFVIIVLSIMMLSITFIIMVPSMTTLNIVILRIKLSIKARYNDT